MMKDRLFVMKDLPIITSVRSFLVEREVVSGTFWVERE